jgi:hypothetical protein
MTSPTTPGTPAVMVDASNPMAHWRRNRWLIGGLVLFLLACVFVIAALFRADSIDKAKTIAANGRLHVALAQADQLKAEKDALIQQAAKAKPGSPAQTQVLKQLQSTTGQSGSNGRDGLPGLPGINGTPGLNGLNGVPGINGSNGINGHDSTSPGPTGATGATGAVGPMGAQGEPGTNGRDGKDGTNSDSAGYSFTTPDGTTYDCTPDGKTLDGRPHYSCSPRSRPTPSPAATVAP